jgi:hypothetical protein
MKERFKVCPGAITKEERIEKDREHLLMLKRYLAELRKMQSGEADEFWCGVDDEKHPLSEFEQMHGCTVSEMVTTVEGHIARRTDELVDMGGL